MRWLKFHNQNSTPRNTDYKELVYILHKLRIHTHTHTHVFVVSSPRTLPLFLSVPLSLSLLHVCAESSLCPGLSPYSTSLCSQSEPEHCVLKLPQHTCFVMLPSLQLTNWPTLEGLIYKIYNP